MKNIKTIKRIKRHARVRSKVMGSTLRPRMTVFRTTKHIYVQFIDDQEKKTLGGISDIKMKKTSGKVALASEVGKAAAELAKKLGFSEIVFDRGGYKYHGRIKSLAEGAREGGLKF